MNLQAVPGWFLTTPGYYDYYISATPGAAWPYSEARDSGQGGYPACKAGWGDKGHGLRVRLLNSYDKRALNAAKSRFSDTWEEMRLRCTDPLTQTQSRWADPEKGITTTL